MYNQRFLFSLLAGLVLAASSHAAPPVSFWVAPDGNDSGQGTKASPFRTLERARAAVRDVLSSQKKDIVVYLRGGTYRLEQTFSLAPEDSGRNGNYVVYRAAPNETPVLTGAVSVGGWSVYDADEGIWAAEVGPRQSRQLYVNGKRMTRARTKDYPSGFRPSPTSGIEFIPTQLLNPGDWYDPATWTHPDKVEAVCVTQWKMTRVGVETVIPYPNFTPPSGPATGLLQMRMPSWKNANVFLERDGPPEPCGGTGEKMPSDGDPETPGTCSFWQVTWFENAYQFLDEAGEWYLDETAGLLFYKPHWSENMAMAKVELPILEVLVEGIGTLDNPVTNIRFEGITFTGATWLNPSTDEGYVTDQSGFHLVGPDHPDNDIDHDPNDVRTPGNVRFRFAHNIVLRGNIFEHLGAVGVDFELGCQNNTIVDNLFEDISSAAIQIGGVDVVDHHPEFPGQVVRENTIINNIVHKTGREYTDAAGIMLGFTMNTLVRNNTIVDVPWSGIAIGWGWGLLDPTGFPGLPGATWYEWGTYDTPTTNRGNRVLKNRFYNFVNVMWDAGAIYTTGAQGSSFDDALLLEGNVATGKCPKGGGNVFYTDGGSRYIVLRKNVSMNNAQGIADFGPPPNPLDPLPYNPWHSLLTGFPYGSDIGGCRTYGDILYDGNYWASKEIGVVCCYEYNGVSYPVNVQYQNENIIRPPAKIPGSILKAAGVTKRPKTIPASRWDAVKTDKP